MMTTQPQPAALSKRLFALVYEGLIMLAVTIIAIIMAAPISYLLQAMPHLQQIAISACFLFTWWWYCKLNWRKGQTLSMKAWRLHLTNAQGMTPPMRQLRSRFLWVVVFLVFVPAISYLVLSHIGALPPKPRFYLSLVWWLLPWGFALFHPSKQFLYDVLAGTQIQIKPSK